MSTSEERSAAAKRAAATRRENQKAAQVEVAPDAVVEAVGAAVFDENVQASIGDVVAAVEERVEEKLETPESAQEAASTPEEALSRPETVVEALPDESRGEAPYGAHAPVWHRREPNSGW